MDHGRAGQQGDQGYGVGAAVAHQKMEREKEKKWRGVEKMTNETGGSSVIFISLIFGLSHLCSLSLTQTMPFWWGKKKEAGTSAGEDKAGR